LKILNPVSALFRERRIISTNGFLRIALMQSCLVSLLLLT